MRENTVSERAPVCVSWKKVEGRSVRRSEERRRWDGRKKMEDRTSSKEEVEKRREPNLKECKHNSEGTRARKASSANSRNRFRHVADHPGTVLINK